MEARLGERFEGWEHLVEDVPPDLIEGPDDGVASYWPFFVERYREGRIDLHLHLRLRRPPGWSFEPQDFCALAKRAGGESEPPHPVVVRPGSRSEGFGFDGAIPSDPTYGDLMGIHEYDVQISVRGIAEGVQPPEGVGTVTTLPPVVGVIGLQTLDDCRRSWVDVPDFVCPAREGEVSRVIEGLEGTGVLTDGERRSAAIFGQRDLLTRHGVGQLIERRAPTAEDFLDHWGKVIGDGASQFGPEAFIACLGVTLSDDSIHWTFAEPLDGLVEFAQTLVRVIEGEAPVGRSGEIGLPYPGGRR